MDINLFRKSLASKQKILKESNSDIPADISNLINQLKLVNGVASVEIDDRWKDGWFRLLVSLKIDNTVQFSTNQSSPMIKASVISQYRYVKSALQKVLKSSGLRVVQFTDPEKKYQYVPRSHKTWGQQSEPVLSGFVGNQISIEVYSKE